MGHAAGELANGVHLLRLAQLIFQLATLREVADVDDDGADGTIGEPVDGDAFHDAPRSVRVMESRFSGDDFSRMAQRFDHADAHRLAIVGFEKIEDRSPDHLLGFPSEMPLRRRRRVGDAALAIDEQQSVGAVFDQRAKPFLARAQRFLRLAPLMFLHVERKRMSDRPLQGLDRDVRLAQVVGCAGFHRLDGDFLGAAAREDHDGGVDAPLADFAQQRKAVARAEHVIEQRDVEPLRGHDAQRIVVGQGGRSDGVLPCIARAQQLHDHRRIFRRVVNDEDSSRFRHTSTPEHTCDSAAEAAEEAFEHAFRALLQRPAMDRAERCRHFISILEILGIGGTAVDRTEVRHTAEFFGVEARGHTEVRRRQLAGRALHEVGPDGERDAGAVRVVTNRRGLIESHPYAGND